MFTTPARASEPYTAEAPAVTTSTRLTRNAGSELMSKPPAGLEATARLPLIRVSVRAWPMSLRLKVLILTSPEPFSCWVGRRIGISATMSLTVVGCFAARSCSEIVVTGVGVSKPLRAMRLPVTTTSSVAGALACGVAGAGWASAAPKGSVEIESRAIVEPPILRFLNNERILLPLCIQGA